MQPQAVLSAAPTSIGYRPPSYVAQPMTGAASYRAYSPTQRTPEYPEPRTVPLLRSAVPSAVPTYSHTQLKREYSPPRTVPLLRSAVPSAVPAMAYSPTEQTREQRTVPLLRSAVPSAVPSIVSSSTMVAAAPVVGRSLEAPRVATVEQSAPIVQPVFLQPPPRDVFVDRPFPVWPEVPVPCMPAPMHSFKGYVGPEHHDFPYHDPAYGMGWRYHYQDAVDEHWNDMSMYNRTPLEALLHRRDEETWQDLWEEAHMGISERGWRHRPLPFSRRVRDPEALIPKERDFYTELFF